MFKNYLKKLTALSIIISMVFIPFMQVYALSSEEALLESLGISTDSINKYNSETQDTPTGSTSETQKTLQDFLEEHKDTLTEDLNSGNTITEEQKNDSTGNTVTEEQKNDSTENTITETPKEEETKPETPATEEGEKDTETSDKNTDKGTYVSTLLIDYAGVSLKRTHSLDKVRFTVTNQEALQIGKVTIDGKEVEYKEDSENKEYKYFEYSGESKVIKLEFYRNNRKEPFSTIFVQILKDDKGYHTNMAPIIKYGQEEDTNRLFEIKDGSKIKEIVIYKSNGKNDYRDENIVFKYTDGKIESINNTYIAVLEQSETSLKMKINKEENDAMYKIIATDNSKKELINQREVRLIGTKENTATMQLDYTGVSIQTGNYTINNKNKLKFTINNQDKVKVEKVKIIPTNPENTDEIKISNSTFYYEQGTDLLKLEFYKKGAMFPFNEMYVYVRLDEEGKYHVNFSPSISYGTESESSRTFNISDLNGIKDIIITRMDGYENNGSTIIAGYISKNSSIYQYSIDKKNSDYIGKVEFNEDKTTCKIEINKKDKYEYYAIKVIDNSGRKLGLERYVKVAGKVSPVQVATTWDMFNPTISVNRSNTENITFKLNKEDKVTSVKAQEVIAGKVSEEVPIENIKKDGDYVTSFTFNREGMYMFTFSNGKYYSYVYYVITVKSDEAGWGLNRSPLVTNSEDNKYEKIDIADSSIYSIEINRRVDGKYTENVFKWENGKIVKNEGANKTVYVGGVDNTKEGHVYLNLLKKEEDNAFQIKVTDKNGAIQLITDRRVSVAKLPATNSNTASTNDNTNKTTTNTSKKKDSSTELKDIATPKTYALAVDSFNPNIKTTKIKGTGLKLTVNESNIEVRKMYIYNIKNGTVDEKNPYRENTNITNKNFYFTITTSGMYRIKCVNEKGTAFYQDIIVTKNSDGEIGGNRSPIVTTVDDGNYEKVIVKDANINGIKIISANKPGSNATTYNDTIFDFDNTSGPYKGVSGYDNNRVYKVDKSEKQVTIWIKKQTAGKYKYKVIATDEAKYDGKTINLTTDRRLWVDQKASTKKSTSSNSNNKADATWKNDADASWSEAGAIGGSGSFSSNSASW